MTYLLYVYVCNKYPVVLVRVCTKMHKIWNYLDSYVDVDLTDLFQINEANEEINKNKYLILDVPIKYFKNLIDENEYLEFKNCCKHEIFNLVVIKTNKDGSFKQQYDQACGLLC